MTLVALPLISELVVPTAVSASLTCAVPNTTYISTVPSATPAQCTTTSSSLSSCCSGEGSFESFSGGSLHLPMPGLSKFIDF